MEPTKPEALKPEAILTFLGLDVKTEEEFKSSFENKFAVKELLLKDPAFASQVLGPRMGSIQAHLRSNAKKMGIDFLPEELKDKKVEELIELSFVKIAEMNKKAMDDVEKSSKGTVEEQVRLAKEETKQAKDKLRDTEGLLIKTANDFEGFKKEQITKGKTDTINNFKKSALSKLDFKQNISAVEKVGFESLLDSKYEFDIDENQVAFIKDKVNGQRIASKKVTGQFMTADEILQEELIANKLAKVNPSGGKPAPKYGTATLTGGNEESVTKKTIYIHPAARAAAGM